MSLTSFLENNADVRAQFLAHSTKPDFKLKSPILAAPLIESHGIVGTAFDYLLRFYMEKMNPDTEEQDWVAHRGLRMLLSHANRKRANHAIRIMIQAKER